LMSIMLIDETQQQLVIHKTYGDAIQKAHIEQYKKNVISLIAKDSMNAYVIAKNKPFYFTDLNSDAEMLAADRRIWDILQFISGLLLPLVVQNKVIGAIDFFLISKNLVLTEENIKKIQQYVSHLATAINNARLAEETHKALQETKRKEQEIAHINQMLQAVNSTLNLDEVMTTAMSALQDVFSFGQIGIFLKKEQEKNLYLAKYYGEGITEEILIAVKQLDFKLEKRVSYVCLPFLKKKPYYISPVTPDLLKHFSPTDKKLYEINPVKAYFLAPLFVQNQVIGTIVFSDRKEAFTLSNKQINTIQQYVSQIATAINNARMTEESIKAKKYVEAANKNLEKLANLDGLTQIANRRFLNEYLDKEWQRLAREQDFLSIILSDIDHFKNYNDTYGHIAGDECLIKVVQGISNCLKRPADLLARYGGEEFVIVLSHTDLDGAISVAETIQTEIANLKIPHAQSTASQYVSLSIGVSCTIPDQERSPQELINTADLLLYQAKESGRNQVKSDLKESINPTSEKYS
jgi:diguanylate cyclase (GGDEF)-like protein